MKFPSILSRFFTRAKNSIGRFPVTLFLILLAVVIGFLALRRSASNHSAESVPAPAPRTATTFTVGKTVLSTSASGTVVRANEITIIASSSGVVANVFVKNGQAIGTGASFLSLAPGAGGNAVAGIEGQSAALQYGYLTDTASKQEKILDLSKKSSDIVATSGAQKDLAKSDWSLGKKSLDNSVAQAGLSLDRAIANESGTLPRAPFAGRVEAIFVHQGDAVALGTPLLTFTGTASHSDVEIDVPADMADRLDPTATATLILDTRTVPLGTLVYLSSDAAIDGRFRAIYAINDDTARRIGDNQNVSVELPLRNDDPMPLVPLSAVREGQGSASILVSEDGYARMRTIVTGPAIGNLIAIRDGLAPGDTVILSREISEGDLIQNTR